MFWVIYNGEIPMEATRMLDCPWITTLDVLFINRHQNVFLVEQVEFSGPFPHILIPFLCAAEMGTDASAMDFKAHVNFL
jgi:hypothetical protein